LSDGQAKRTSFLGGTDEEVENAWKWLDGTPWKYTQWRKGEPNGGMNENCLILDLEKVKDKERGEWNDINCVNPFGYICSYFKGKFH
jgi:hypothetical protein